MRTWRDLRRAQRAGESKDSPADPWDWMLANPHDKPGCSQEHRKLLEFQEIVERILTEDTDNDWESIRNSCPDCRGVHSSPWDHYVYHRNRFHTEPTAGRDGGATTEERAVSETRKETSED